MAKLQNFQVVLSAGLLQIFLRIIVLVEAQNTSFSFSHFTTSEGFLMIDDVIHDAGNASFAMNSMNMTDYSDSPSTSRCGRLLYKDRVRMKDSPSGAVASFNTAFSFHITGPSFINNVTGGVIHGDGMAFTFVRSNASTTETGENAGGSLCLLESRNDGLPSNRLFAVEFDTFLNPGYNDSSDSHVGVNINSMRSSWSHNLCPNDGASVTNCTYLANGSYYTAWIDYDSHLEQLHVSFVRGSLYGNTSLAKPPQPLIAANLSLSDLMDEYMYVGFSSATGGVFEIHTIQSWSFNSSGLPDAVEPDLVAPASGSRKYTAILSALVSIGAVLVAVGIFIAIMTRRRISLRRRYNDQGSLVDQDLVPRMFKYKELGKATKHFHKSEFLGSGGFGAVYSGRLPSGARVAVKKMRMEGRHEKESFQAEVASLSHIRHRNLVRLRGWCHEEDQLLLVYDFMCNGSLDNWLFWKRGSWNEGGKTVLTLDLRRSILSGVAAALFYLHEECEKCVLHRDIKSSNVLLDGDWNAYLGDFGLARLIDHQKMEKTTAMAGTFGYMAPEMPSTWKATKESDVYGFGVLVLEVMCGKRALEMSAIERGEAGVLVDRVWRAHEAGDILQVADSRLKAGASSLGANSSKELEIQENASALITNDHVYDVVTLSLEAGAAPDGSANGAMEGKKLMVRNLMHLGLLCCNPNPENRPSMRLVSQLLQPSENDMVMSLPPLPGCKPKALFMEIGFLAVNMPSLSPWPSYEFGDVDAGALAGSSQVSTTSTASTSSVVV